MMRWSLLLSWCVLALVMLDGRTSLAAAQCVSRLGNKLTVYTIEGGFKGWQVYLDPKWARQRLRMYGAQDRALEQSFKKLEEEMAETGSPQQGKWNSALAGAQAAAKRSKRTKVEQANKPTQPTKDKGTTKGKAAEAKPATQPGRWLDQDCEHRWRPLEVCYWPEQGALPVKGKEYPGLGYKRLRNKPPKAQQQQPVVAQ
ncbi:hypothetical protein HaLaN_12087 [Haematococcus lacustris]|uniref:Uncharacterized protein n=1 Tax=Haematococcus lacustris TaxID=44745 RepID=A0A699Z968_HAELA|nr:hypothetical protein HaLaN_12087 [Haematococcus lacustris]